MILKKKHFHLDVKRGEIYFFAINLSLESDFDRRTQKTEIISHTTIETSHVWWF